MSNVIVRSRGPSEGMYPSFIATTKEAFLSKASLLVYFVLLLHLWALYYLL